MNLIYLVDGRHHVTCPRCQLAAVVELHDDRLTVQCVGDCGDVLEHVEAEDIASQLLMNGHGTAPTTNGNPPKGDGKSEKPKPGKAIVFPTVEPWPEPVDGGGLAEGISTAIERHVALPLEATVATTLWIFFTHVHDSSPVSPILAITSPAKRCGKTTLLSVLARFVPRPLPSSSITPAALFRVLEAVQPCLLVDEADTFLAAREELRGILNSGHTASGAFVIRTVGDGSNAEVRQFRTWGPKAIAAIGKLADTLADRSIAIRMERRKPGETIEPVIAAEDPYLDLRRKLVRWAQDNPDAAKTLSAVPDGLDDRAADNWRPLLSVAEVLGGEWSTLARSAASALSSTDRDDDSACTLLLADLRDLFEADATPALATTTIIASLTARDDRPWPEWGRQRKPLTSRGLSKLLEPFGVKPRTIRLGSETAKGYRLEQFEEAFARYLPSPSVTASQPAPQAENRESLSVTPTDRVTDSNGADPALQLQCDGVTDTHPPAEASG